MSFQTFRALQPVEKSRSPKLTCKGGSNSVRDFVLNVRHGIRIATAETTKEGHMRILVIDDNVDCAYMLKALIELCGHETEAVTTAEEGLRRAQEWQPNLIFLDIAMPSTDGYGLATELRAEALDSTKIVAVSGYKPDEAQCAAAGIDDYLMKPPSLKQLTEFFDCDRLQAA